MSKTNIMNYVVFNTAELLNATEQEKSEKDVVDIIADNWSKKHFVSNIKGRNYHYDPKIKQKFLF